MKFFKGCLLSVQLFMFVRLSRNIWSSFFSHFYTSPNNLENRCSLLVVRFHFSGPRFMEGLRITIFHSILIYLKALSSLWDVSRYSILKTCFRHLVDALIFVNILACF